MCVLNSGVKGVTVWEPAQNSRNSRGSKTCLPDRTSFATETRCMFLFVERYRVSVKAVRGSKIPKLANTPEQFCHLWPSCTDAIRETREMPRERDSWHITVGFNGTETSSDGQNERGRTPGKGFIVRMDSTLSSPKRSWWRFPEGTRSKQRRFTGTKFQLNSGSDCSAFDQCGPRLGKVITSTFSSGCLPQSHEGIKRTWLLISCLWVARLIDIRTASTYTLYNTDWKRQNLPLAFASVGLTRSLPREINFLLQSYQKYNITQYDELGFSYLMPTKDDYTATF